MKNVLFALLFFCTSAVTAQTEMGKFFIGGSTDLTMAFSSSHDEYQGHSSDDVKNTKISFSPTMGYFFADNVLIGISLPYEYQKQSGSSISTIGLLPFGRIYVGATNVRPFFQGALGYISSTLKYNNQEVSVSGFGLQGAIGLSIFLNQNVAIDISGQYEYSSLSPSEDSNYKSITKTFGINGGVSVFFGN